MFSFSQNPSLNETGRLACSAFGGSSARGRRGKPKWHDHLLPKIDSFPYADEVKAALNKPKSKQRRLRRAEKPGAAGGVISTPLGKARSCGLMPKHR